MGEIPLLGVAHVLIGSALSLHLLLTKQKPVSAVLWLAVVWGIPYAGALAYLGFGVDRISRRANLRQASRAYVAGRAAAHPTFGHWALPESHGAPFGRDANPASHIFRATDPAVRPNRVLRGNRARLLVDGDEYYPDLFAAIEDARDSVHLQTFIIRRDGTGRELVGRLAERARAGVEVRLLYDRFGSTIAHLTRFFEPARRAGARVSSITQANVLKGHFQVNLRNHRKVVVIDGRIGYLGGMNIHDENVRGRSGGLPIRDYQVRLEGPAVADLQFQFVEDWHFATGESPEVLLGSRFFPDPAPAGAGLVQIVAGGPELEGRGLADAIFGAIVSAERSITIVTPYFVPDEPILQGLRYAALRGVDVRLVLPARNNHWYTGMAARALYGPLLAAGVRIFERRPPFLHAKAMLIDGVYAMVGSANLDHRSLCLSFETNAEIVEATFVERLREQIGREIEASVEVTAEVHDRRPVTRRLVENLCFLFQPLL